MKRENSQNIDADDILKNKIHEFILAASPGDVDFEERSKKIVRVFKEGKLISYFYNKEMKTHSTEISYDVVQ